MFMLTGTYPMTVDSKARITLPAAHRKELGKTIKLVPFQGCVYGFTPEAFDEWLHGLFEHGDEHFNPRSRSDEKLSRGLAASAVEVEVDSAGRIALGKLDIAKPGRRLRLGLEGEVVVLGNRDHFEVWNSEKWAEEEASYDEELDALIYDD